ncbi:5'-nucleotidase domain-containing protein 1 [Aplysia californica]|uniref:5'-nucleotidase domain-containing protein 1 n=1 Tax=Aplysia californica TaxID=6500 RepID=A0ABM0K6K2_APLCA|nr:5'-nucleotidase domain-containing protein 1 [Aplysia californica]
MSSVNFTKYDAFGFDMDFTLARYELVPFFNMVYDCVRKYLVEVKKYDASIFHRLQEDKELIYKGLIVDFEKGNILKLGSDGVILRATHGTQKMTAAEIERDYGAERKFGDYDIFKNGMKSIDSKWRFFENYFDTPGLVAFAKIIDYMHKAGTEEGRTTFEHIWKDVLNALEDMYIPSQYAQDKGAYFPEMKKNIGKYIDPASQQIKDWLKSLRQDNRVVFLLTSSYVDFAHLVMEHVFGSEWKSLFDFTLYAGRKPRFFTESKPFSVVEDGLKLGGEVKSLTSGGAYCYGNHVDLMDFLRETTGKTDPKVIYFGDNLWADAWPSKTLGKWDTVLILEEMDAEGYAVSDGTVPGHEDEVEDPDAPPKKRKRKYEHSTLVTDEEIELMVSEFWGSIFIDDSQAAGSDSQDQSFTDSKTVNTAFGNLIGQFADICVPSIEYLAGVPVDHVFTTFSKEPGNSRGFHPGRPRSLLP